MQHSPNIISKRIRYHNCSFDDSIAEEDDKRKKIKPSILLSLYWDRNNKELVRTRRPGQ